MGALAHKSVGTRWIQCYHNIHRRAKVVTEALGSSRCRALAPISASTFESGVRFTSPPLFLRSIYFCLTNHPFSLLHTSSMHLSLIKTASKCESFRMIVCTKSVYSANHGDLNQYEVITAQNCKAAGIRFNSFSCMLAFVNARRVSTLRLCVRKSSIGR